MPSRPQAAHAQDRRPIPSFESIVSSFLAPIAALLHPRFPLSLYYIVGTLLFLMRSWPFTIGAALASARGDAGRKTGGLADLLAPGARSR